MIKLILETIIPSEPELEMPSAAEIDFDSYTVRYGLEEMVSKYLVLVDTLAHNKFMLPFSTLDSDARLAILNVSRRADIRMFSEFLTHVFRAYYTNRDVLKRIGSGSIPPFPDGNTIEQDDWSILEPVYSRGQIFRRVEAATP